MWPRRGARSLAEESTLAGIGTVLARARDVDGAALLGTRDAIHVVSPADGQLTHRWEEIAEAAWEADSETLTLRPTAAGTRASRHHLPDAGRATRRLLQLIDERVRASIVLQRHVRVRGKLGITVVARRAPHGDAALIWQITPDAGLDPAAPDVQQAMTAARALAADELGEHP